MNIVYAQNSSTVQKAVNTKAISALDSSSQNESLQRKADLVNNATQRAETPRPNNTGMPDNLKSGIESLSGFSMDDVRVHYNSSKPATVQALAYTQGTDIHVAPGQEKHLPHEAWHVAQQMAGRVSPTTNINGMSVNDNAGLEHEADVMGEKAVQCKKGNEGIILFNKNISKNGYIPIFQRKKYCMSHNVKLIQSPKKTEKNTDKEAFERHISETLTTGCGFKIKDIIAKIRTELSTNTNLNTDLKERIEQSLKEYEKKAKGESLFKKDEFSECIKGEKKENILDFLKKIIEPIGQKQEELRRFGYHTPHINAIGNGERKRKDSLKRTVEQKLNIDNSDLMGGHLIKSEWGGEDNMINVAVWKGGNGSAESMWSSSFEDIIESKFVLGDVVSANILVTSIRENKWTESEDSKKCGCNTNKWSKLSKLNVNTAMEMIPFYVKGEVTFNNSDYLKSEIGASLTGYESVGNNLKNQEEIKYFKESFQTNKLDQKKRRVILNKMMKMRIQNDSPIDIRTDSIVKRVTRLNNENLKENLLHILNEHEVINLNILMIHTQQSLKLLPAEEVLDLTDNDIRLLWYIMGKITRKKEYIQEQKEASEKHKIAIFSESLNLNMLPWEIEGLNLFINENQENLLKEYGDYCKKTINNEINDTNYKDELINYIKTATESHLYSFIKDQIYDIRDYSQCYKEIHDFKDAFNVVMNMLKEGKSTFAEIKSQTTLSEQTIISLMKKMGRTLDDIAKFTGLSE